MPSSLSLPDGRELSYKLDSPSPHASVVLLANSLAAPFAVWDHVVPVILAKGFAVLRFDQPGHGLSSAPKGLDTTFESIADDVAELLKHLDIAKLHAWIGVSMGAATGIYFATRHPNKVHKLIVCDTISHSAPAVGAEDVFGPRVQAARDAATLTPTLESTRERWFGKAWLEANPAETERLRGLMQNVSLDGFESCCHALSRADFDLRPLFSRVGAGVDQVHLAVGEKDANLPETMAAMRDAIQEGFQIAGKNIPPIQLVTIKNAGHVCFIDGLEQFKTDVISFLDR